MQTQSHVFFEVDYNFISNDNYLNSQTTHEYAKKH